MHGPSRPPGPVLGSRLGSWVLTLALAAVGGGAADQAGLPLAWVIGPLAVCAVGSIAGLPLRPLPKGRELGQAVVGVAIGLRFTAPVLAMTLSFLPAMVVATIFVVVVTTVAALLFRPMGGVDNKTAFFATAAAGMADMAFLARERGGDADVVSLVHALRVASVVTVVPSLVVLFGTDGGLADTATTAAGSYPELALVLAAGIAGAYLVKPLGLPNPWLVGPIFAGALLAATDLLVVAIPGLLMILAQMMIGIALGCRFRREILVRLPRVAAAGLAISAFMIAAAAVGAAALAQMTGLDYATSFLAIAPAGAAEMVLTAKVMHLNAEIVTAFQVMRIAVIASTILIVFSFFERVMRLFHGSRT